MRQQLGEILVGWGRGGEGRGERFGLRWQVLSLGSAQFSITANMFPFDSAGEHINIFRRVYFRFG